MKKVFLISLMFVIALIAACEEGTDQGQVEITFPASMIAGEDVDDAIEAAKAEGVEEVIQNDDGSLTYKMSRSTHRNLMAEVEDEINELLEELKNDEDYLSIQDVQSNRSFSEFTVSVDQKAFENSLDGFVILGLGIQGMYYQLLDGVDPSDYKVTIYLEDADNGEVFETIIYPDAFEQLQ